MHLSYIKWQSSSIFAPCTKKPYGKTCALSNNYSCQTKIQVLKITLHSSTVELPHVNTNLDLLLSFDLKWTMLLLLTFTDMQLDSHKLFNIFNMYCKLFSFSAIKTISLCIHWNTNFFSIIIPLWKLFSSKYWLKRIVDEAQPWRRPVVTENQSV